MAPSTGAEEEVDKAPTGAGGEDEQDEMAVLFDSEHEEIEQIEDPDHRPPETPLFLQGAGSSRGTSASAGPFAGETPLPKANGNLRPPSVRSLSSDPLDSRSRTGSSVPAAGPSLRRSNRSSAQASTSASASAASPRPPRRRGPPTIEIPLLPLPQLRKYSLPFDLFPPSQSSRHRLPGVREERTSKYIGASSDDFLGSQDQSDDESDESIRIMSPPPRRSSRSATLRNGSTSAPPGRRRRGPSPSTISEMSSDFGGYGRPTSDVEGEEEEEEDSEEDTSDDPLAFHRTTRSEAKGKGREEEGRRMTRSRRAEKRRDQPTRHRRDLSSLSASSSESEHYHPRSRQPPKPRAMPNGKRKRGRSTASASDFFPGEDVPSEEVSDDDVILLESADEEALYRHRSFCEKCSRGTADDLLAKLLKRKAKPKKAGRPRKKDEDAYSEEEVLRNLEGWVECKTCVVASHFGCLGGSQKIEVRDRLRLMDGPPRPGERLRHSLYIHESTTFTCAKCKANPRCFVCHQDKLDGSEPIKGDDDGAPPKVNGHPTELSDTTTQEPIANGDVEMADASAATVDDQSQTLTEGPTPDKVEEPAEAKPKKEQGLDEEEVEEEELIEDDEENRGPLKFRCLRCKQSAHYAHLKQFHPEVEMSAAALAENYQRRSEEGGAWMCHQCREWTWAVDSVIAWRPLPADAKEDFTPETPFYKDHLPREYLVKWMIRGFRHVTWVPHLWLLANSAQRLRNFLEKGPMLDLITDETLAAHGDDMTTPTIARVLEEDDRVQGEKGHTHHHEEGEWRWGGPPPDVDAESSVPKAWSAWDDSADNQTVDRILEVMLRPPPSKNKMNKLNGKGKGKKPKRAMRVVSESDSERSTPGAGFVYPPLPDGLEPPRDQQMDIDAWESKTRRYLSEEDVDEVAGLVSWAYIKWDDLQHDQSTWDTPPPVDSDLYPAFKNALARFLRARNVRIPVLSKKEIDDREKLAERLGKPPDGQHETIKGGTLMPFQIEGFMWLVYNHFKRHSCILADDMGLGKTIQIAAMLGYLVSFKVYPCLVIVPNSTITNWVREFEKWVPSVRVVAYYGEAASRKVISKYELYRKGMQGQANGLKAHVVLTTYDMITGGEFSVFSKIPRWEVVCVDEGQRLKSGSALIFNRLRSLNSIHRVLMTGTPLNNNIRELFNLLSFLDPKAFTFKCRLETDGSDLENLEKKFDQDTLDEAKVKELHEMIRPYILRRIKADVLKLPPKIETIIPISLAPMQKQVYKIVLERNQDVIRSIMANRVRKVRPVQLVVATMNGEAAGLASGTVEEPIVLTDGEEAGAVGSGSNGPVANGDEVMANGDITVAQEGPMDVDAALPEVSVNGEQSVPAPQPDTALPEVPVSE